MVQRRSVAWLRLIAALVATVGCLLTTAVVPAKKVAAQTPFLSTPYYGSEIRTRVFNPPGLRHSNESQTLVKWKSNSEASSYT
jgi:hypothetical protein